MIYKRNTIVIIARLPGTYRHSFLEPQCHFHLHRIENSVISDSLQSQGTSICPWVCAIGQAPLCILKCLKNSFLTMALHIPASSLSSSIYWSFTIRSDLVYSFSSLIAFKLPSWDLAIKSFDVQLLKLKDSAYLFL